MASTARGRDDHLGSSSCVERRPQTQRPVHRSDPYASSLLARLANRLASSVSSIFSSSASRQSGHCQPQAIPRLPSSSPSRLLYPIPSDTPAEADSSSQLEHGGRRHRQSSFVALPAPLWSARQNKPVHGIRPSVAPLSTTAVGSSQQSPHVSSSRKLGAAALPTGPSADYSQRERAPSPSPFSGRWGPDTPAQGAYSVPSLQQSSESASYPLAFGRRGTSHPQRAPFRIATAVQRHGEPHKERSKPFAESLFESQQQGTLGLAASSRAVPSPVGFPGALQLHGHQSACERAIAPVVVQEKDAFSQTEAAETGRVGQHFSSFPSCTLGSRFPPRDKQQRHRRPLPSAREPAGAVSKVERGSTALRCAARKQRFVHEKAADTTLPPVPLLGKLRSNLSAEASLGPGDRLFRQESLTVDQLQRLYLRCQPLRWRVKLRQLFCQEAEHYDSSTLAKKGSETNEHGGADLGPKTAVPTSCGILGATDDAAQRGKSRSQQREQSGKEEREATGKLPDNEGEPVQAAQVGGVLNERSAGRSPDGVTTGARSGPFSLTDGKAGPASGSAGAAAIGSAERSGSDEALSAAQSAGQPHPTGEALSTGHAASQTSHSFDAKNAERSDGHPASTSRSAEKLRAGAQPDAPESVFGGSSLFGNAGGGAFSFSSTQTKTSLFGDLRTTPHEGSSAGSSEAGTPSLVPKSAHTAVSVGEGSSTKPSNSNEERLGASAAPATSTLFGRSGDTTTAGGKNSSSRGLFMGSSFGVLTSPSESLPTFGIPAPADTVCGSQQNASLFSSTSFDSSNASALSASGRNQPSKLGDDKQGAGERPEVEQTSSSGGRDPSPGTAATGVLGGDKPKGETDEKSKNKGVVSADTSAPGSTSDGPSSSTASALPWWQQNVGKACLVQVEDDGFAPDDEKDDGEDNEEGDSSGTTEKGKHTGATPAAGSVAALAAFQPAAAGSSGSIFGTYSASKSMSAPAAAAASIFGSSSGVFSSLSSSSGSAPSTTVVQSLPSASGSTAVPSLFVFGGGANTGTSFSNSGSLFGSSVRDKPPTGNSLFGGSIALKPSVTSETAGLGSGAGQTKPAAGGLGGASSSVPDEPGTAKKTGLFVFGSAPTQQSNTTGSGGGGGKRGREGREEDGGQPAMKSVFGGTLGGGGLFGSVKSVTPSNDSAALTTFGTNPAAESSSGSTNPFGFSRVDKDSSGVSATSNSSLFGNRSATPVFGLGADSKGGGSTSGGASSSSLFGSSNTTTGNALRFGGQSLTASAGSSVFGISSNTCSLFGASSSSTGSATGGSSAAGSGWASSQARPSTTSFFSFSAAPSSTPAGASTNLHGGRITFGSSSAAQAFGLSPSGAGGDTGQASSEGVSGRPAVSMFGGSGAGGGGSQAEGSGLLAPGAVVRRPRLTIKRTKN